MNWRENMNNKKKFANLRKDILDVIEDIIAIIIAAGILIFGWLVDKEIFKNAPLLWSGVISILIVMAIGNLRDRRRRFQKIHNTVDKTFQEIQGNKVLEPARVDDFFDGKEEDIQECLLSATTIDIVGITFSTTVGKTLDLVRDRLRANGTVRIILLDSDSGDALEQLVKRSWSKKASKEKYIAMIENTSDLLEEISNEPEMGGSFEIGFLPFIPTVGMTLVDVDQDMGVGVVTIYHQLKKGELSFSFTKEDAPETFDFYKEQFDAMWDECRANKVRKIV